MALTAGKAPPMPLRAAAGPSSASAANLRGVRGAYAIYMIDDSMEPRYRQGWLLHVNPFTPPTHGHDVVVYKAGHAVLIKQFVRWEGDALVLCQLNPHEELRIPRDEVLECHLVVGVDQEEVKTEDVGEDVEPAAGGTTGEPAPSALEGRDGVIQAQPTSEANEVAADVMGVATASAFGRATKAAVAEAHRAGFAVPGRRGSHAIEITPEGHERTIDENQAWSPTGWKAGRDS